MSPDLPPQVVPTGASSPAQALPVAEVAALPVGELLAGTVEPPPGGASPGVFRIVLGGFPLLLLSELFLLPGERLIAEVEPGGGEGRLRLLARSGAPGGRLEVLQPGQVRLAPGQVLAGEVRALLAGARAPLRAEVLPFDHPSRAPVRLGGREILVQLDANTRPGDRLFVLPQRSGGALGLRVIARGGPRAAAPPPGPRGLLQLVRAGGPQAAQSPAEPALVPGAVLRGTLVRILPPPGPAGPRAGAPSGAAPPPEGRPGPPPAGGPVPPSQARAAAGPSPGARATALIRFAGFDIEVPWPAEAAGAFSPGDPVRVLVRGVGARLDLELLPPGAPPDAGAEAGARWIPPGGAGERSFGAQFLGLGEGLAASRQGWPPGPLARAAEGLERVLGRMVLREGELTPEGIREALEGAGAPPAREGEPGGRALELRESLQRFLAAAREAGARADDPALSGLAAGAERALASAQFLQTANSLRLLLEQGLFLQIPYALGGERGTMNIVIRREGKEREDASDRDSYTAVFFLDLEGLGPLRIDAALYRDQASVRFTTPSQAVGRFLEAELPKLREGIEAHRIGVDAVSWTLGKVQPEPVLPAAGPEVSEGTSFIDLKV